MSKEKKPTGWQKQGVMPEDQCKDRASEKGCGETGKLRCGQAGSEGSDLPESKEWIEEQEISRGYTGKTRENESKPSYKEKES